MAGRSGRFHDRPAGGLMRDADHTTRLTDSGAPNARASEQQLETAAIRVEIEETRARISRDLDQLGARLNPEHVKDQIKDNIREATIGRVENMARDAADRVGEARRGIMDTVRENPIPAAMAAIGIGWLYMNGRQQDGRQSSRRHAESGGQWNSGYAPPPIAGYGAYESPGASHDQSPIERVKEGAGAAGENLKEKVEGVAESAQHAAERVVDMNTQQVRRLEDTFHENPLVIGAATVALGFAAGLAAPRTHAEVKVLGDVRDKVADRVGEAVSETTDRAQQVAERVIDETSRNQPQQEQRPG